MNNQNGNYGGIPGSAPYYNMNLPSQNNGVMPTQQIQTPVSPLQQFSNYNQPSVKRIPARIINDPKEIMPNEVPMDGSVSLFPTADYSCVYAKAWNANGMIDTAPIKTRQLISSDSSYLLTLLIPLRLIRQMNSLIHFVLRLTRRISYRILTQVPDIFRASRLDVARI